MEDLEYELDDMNLFMDVANDIKCRVSDGTIELDTYVSNQTKCCFYMYGCLCPQAPLLSRGLIKYKDEYEAALWLVDWSYNNIMALKR